MADADVLPLPVEVMEGLSLLLGGGVAEGVSLREGAAEGVAVAVFVPLPVPLLEADVLVDGLRDVLTDDDAVPDGVVEEEEDGEGAGVLEDDTGVGVDVGVRDGVGVLDGPHVPNAGWQPVPQWAGELPQAPSELQHRSVPHERNRPLGPQSVMGGRLVEEGEGGVVGATEDGVGEGHDASGTTAPSHVPYTGWQPVPQASAVAPHTPL